MKGVKSISLIMGILMILLAGCFNPITVIPSQEGEQITADYAPFTVDINIGKNGRARSIAGPGAGLIQTGNIRNVIQLMVLNSQGEIVAFDEARRGSDNEAAATLTIESIPFNNTYNFLLLMGHWDRDYEAEKTSGGTYVYIESLPPTLLAAGLKEVTVTGAGTVTITMWPIVVDTKFTTANVDVTPETARTVEPAVTDGKPGRANLLPVDWDVTWTIKRGDSNTNGLTDLIDAQKKLAPASGNELIVKSKRIIGRGDGFSEIDMISNSPGSSGNVITQSISTFTSGMARITTEGSVNFRLEYVPFNMTSGWAAFNDDSAFDLTTGTPIWVIRNGINDAAQNSKTDFQNIGKGEANGNGAVSFGITEAYPGGGETEKLIVKDGKFLGPSNSTTPKIQFTTEGYTGDAVAYYAVVDGGAGEPGFGQYAKTLGAVAFGTHQKAIELDSAPHDYDVYVRILKGGKISLPIKISTLEGNPDIGWEWGNENP
jgi:hypothetical protein